MKRKLIAALVVLLLFGGAAFALLGTKEPSRKQEPAPSSAAVKICPHSGLPCDGDGGCDGEECGSEDSCGSDVAGNDNASEQ